MIFDVFGLFLTSWRSGRCLKTFLEVVRFIATEYEPMTIHQPPNCPDVYDFWLILFRPTFQSSTFFEKVDPMCLLRPNPSVENTPMMIIWLWAFHEKLEFETFFLKDLSIFTLRLATCRQKTLSHFKPSEASFKMFYFCSPKSECPRFFYFKKIPAFPKSHSPIDLKHRKTIVFAPEPSKNAT